MFEQLSLDEAIQRAQDEQREAPDVQQAPAVKWGKQLQSVYDLMKDQHWRTLREIEHFTGYPQASISARLRQLDNEKGIAHEKRRATTGLVEYRLLPVSEACG